MDKYRLHIDIPFGSDENTAIEISKKFIDWCIESEAARAELKAMGIESINYRLGFDTDRKKSNYLDKNENDHVSNHKTRVDLT